MRQPQPSSQVEAGDFKTVPHEWPLVESAYWVPDDFAGEERQAGKGLDGADEAVPALARLVRIQQRFARSPVDGSVAQDGLADDQPDRSTS